MQNFRALGLRPQTPVPPAAGPHNSPPPPLRISGDAPGRLQEIKRIENKKRMLITQQFKHVLDFQRRNYAITQEFSFDF